MNNDSMVGNNNGIFLLSQKKNLCYLYNQNIGKSEVLILLTEKGQKSWQVQI